VTAGPGIRGFATICCLGHYRDVVSELVEAVLESRLYDCSESFELAVLGAVEDQDLIAELVRPFEKIRISYRSADIGEYEFPALGLLQDACRTWSGNVYYLHTKGVSHSRVAQHVRYWRGLMLDQVVRNHSECTRLLLDHHAVGTNWRGDHYSGNFWWARAEHVRRLPDVRALRTTPRPITVNPTLNVRLQCEFWVSMARGRFANLGVAGLDLYQTIRWTVNAADVINDLLMSFDGDRYTELVMDSQSPYLAAVNARVKRSVPVNSPASAAAAVSDADVVLVDTSHDEDDCLGVLEACVAGMRGSTAIVVHDSNPPTQWHQRPATDYAPGTEWNGTVWKAILRFRLAHPDTWVSTVDADWGCTVVLPAVRADRPIEVFPRVGTAASAGLLSVADLGWDWFERNRERVLGLVSLSRFRRDLYMTPFRLGHQPITGRTQVLNCLVSMFGLERYLELGVADGENFEAVIAPVRQSVDPQAHATFRMTSDEFFASGRGCTEYDLIFIDALHEEAQCLRDIENALTRLCANGCIVVHDTSPPTEWHQRPASHYQPGEDWNGTVWKAVVRFRQAHPDVAVVTLDVDWGCTVIRRGPAPQPVPTITPLTWDALDQHRDGLLNLRPATWAELHKLAEDSHADH
jgi:Methyltransferase domain